MSTTLPQRFSPDQHQRGGAAAMATWAQVEVDLPAVAATMRAYLDQIAVVLRPGPGTGRGAGGTRTGTDAQDAFLAGMRATVQAVVHDVDVVALRRNPTT